MTRRCHISAILRSASQLELLPVEPAPKTKDHRHAEQDWRDYVERRPLTPFAKQSIAHLREFSAKIKGRTP